MANDDARGSETVSAAEIERRRTAEALARSEEKLRLIVDSARDYAIFSMDLERRVSTWNIGAERILGYSEQEILGQPGDVIFTDEDRAAGAPQHEAGTALKEGHAQDERWHQRKDRSRFWSSGMMMVMRSPQGENIGLLKILRDQTESKRIEEELKKSRIELERSLAEMEQARREAEAANRAKDRLLAAVSHELRTPLTPALMVAETLLRSPDLPPRVVEGLQVIRRNIELETSFIDDLLDVTRISHGKLELAREPIDIHESIRRAVEISQPDIGAKRQQLTVDLAARHSRALGDSKRLQQVFWNLLKNAAKFSPEGGTIRISSRNESAASIVIEVTDTGRGFDPRCAVEIFEAFRQEDTSISRKFGGLGLGLTIAKAVVEGHGGTIVASSDGHGKGARFTARLPLAPER